MDESDYIAVGAAVISLAAIGVSCYLFYLQRKDGRKTSAPIIDFHKSTLFGLEYFVENNGSGVAIIQDLAIYLKNEKVAHNPTSDPFDSLFRRLGKVAVDYEFFLPNVGDSIAAQSNRCFLKISPHSGAEEAELIERISCALRIELTYTSLLEPNKKVTLSCV